MIDRLAELGVMPAEPKDNVVIDSSPSGEAFEANLRIQAKIEKVRLAIDMLQPYKTRIEQAITQEESAKNQTVVDKTYSILKADLTDLDAELKGLKAMVDGEADMDPKDKENMLTNITCYYKDYEGLLKRGQSTYSELKNISKKVLVKKIHLVDDSMPAEQINEMVENNPQAFQQLIKQKVMGKLSNELLYNAQDIVEKCEGIKRLQNDVKELVSMLRDISQIVALQGEKVNSISQHITEAKDYVAQGNKNLEKAKEYHASYRCKLLIILAIVVVLLVVVLVPIIVNAVKK